jgi:hypothetical protein
MQYFINFRHFREKLNLKHKKPQYKNPFLKTEVLLLPGTRLQPGDEGAAAAVIEIPLSLWS